MPDALVVGSGPNGLAAAIALAQAGRSVSVLEGADTLGGGCRSAELTLPGFVHDTCSTVHALALASPFLSSLPLERHGFEPVHPEVPLAHPLDDGSAVLLERSVADTARGLGPDERAYRRLFEPLVRDSEALFAELLGPLRPPRRPLLMARFGLSGLRSAVGLARSRFEDERARALLGGCAAHSMLSVRAPASAAFGLVLMLSAHAVGWPVARGGSQRLADALAAHLRELGGSVATGQMIESLDELPRGAGRVLLDLAPRGVLELAGGRLPERYRRALSRYRYGPGIFKLDWALDGPIPWRAPEVARAGTVHLGGTLDELAASEHAAVHGHHHERPFVLLVQPSCRPQPGPGGAAHGLGLLPRAVGLHARHDSRHRGPGGALCTRLPRADRRPARDGQRRGRAPQSQLRGRRDHRRQPGPAPALHAPGGTAGALLHPGARPVHLLRVHAAGRRRPRDVRLLGRARRAAPLRPSYGTTSIRSRAGGETGPPAR